MILNTFFLGLDVPVSLNHLIHNFYSSGFDNLFAFMGRQSGKDIMIAAMALYEVERLRMTSDPHKSLGIKAEKPINIFIVSPSVDQSQIIFNKIKDFALSDNCNLSNHVSKIEGTTMYFEKDKICLSCVTSTSREFTGQVFYCILMNNLRDFKNCEEFFNDVLMSTNSFNRVGDFKPHYIVTTAADDEDSYIENILTEIKDTNTIIGRWPTWMLNKTISQESLRNSHKYMSKEDFDCEFGCITRKPQMTTISIRVPVKDLEKLKQVARERSYNEGETITYSNIIREYISEINNAL